ncbi:TIGR02221 family CRISPR-associated protein [Leadbettera azotonutricia]|uniref:Putative crispr-associated protein, family n=1 Tax=Leadbettera azotonutricia (strain ATCC BAA-888 / DSM 13862 / ZAS-9) TaxID=545695 RepID=F5YCJ1_LEAAZ|nr:TIGR02221 family CRISPR-associated protein [Leadbettera azotonutricia]AEF80718.1 putative crispr-associated protein, family [Leadbettera azotonutricia ZAS-9]
MMDNTSQESKPSKRRNIFIAFLGTGDYKECVYSYSGNKIKTKFAQRATIDFFCKNYTENDKIFIVLTEGAKEKHWDVPEIGLKSILESLNTTAKIETVDIPDGKSEMEIWDIFSKIYDVLDNDDSVIFDITHGFRSLPMLGFAILNYARHLKNINVMGIYYGAYEARNEENTAPIFNLTPFYQLMQWSSAADTFVNYGIGDKLMEIVNIPSPSSKQYPISEEMKDQSTSSTAGVKSSIEAVTESMATLRGSEIINGKIFQNCRENIDKLEAAGNYQAPFKPIFDRLREKIIPFKTKEPLNFLHAVKWHLDHKMLPEALTMMQEGIITYLLSQQKADFHNREYREVLRKYLNYTYRFNSNKNIDDWKFTNDDKQLIQNLSLDINNSALKNFAVVYNKVSWLRNDINHGGFDARANSYSIFKKEIKQLFGRLRNICQPPTAS